MKKSLLCLLLVIGACAWAQEPPPLPSEGPPPLPGEPQATSALPPPLPQAETQAPQAEQPPPLPVVPEPGPGEESAQTAPSGIAPETVLDAALKRCGESFGWTIDWPFVALGAGCSVQYPAGWVPHWATGQGGSVFSSVLWIDGPEAAYFDIQMLVPGTYTTAESQVPLAAQALRSRFPDLKVTNVQEAPLPPGINGRVLNVYFRFDDNGKPAVGALQLPFLGCSPWMAPCTLTAQGVWSTLDSLSANACTLKAIASTFHCPHGGADGCDDQICNNRCRAKGFREGSCQDDVCSCSGESY